jgi:hypothetical protein
MARVALQRGQVGAVAGVGQLVEVDDGLIARGQPVEHEVAADEAGAAGDKNHVLPLSHGAAGLDAMRNLLRWHEIRHYFSKPCLEKATVQAG